MFGGLILYVLGFVFQINLFKVMIQFVIYMVQKLFLIEEDGQNCFNQVGGFEIVIILERFEELKRKYGYVVLWGVKIYFFGLDQCKKVYLLFVD